MKIQGENMDDGLPIRLVEHEGEALLYETFYGQKQADDYLQQLENKIDWRQDSMRMYGKDIALPRLTASFGEQYVYSGIRHAATPIPPLLQEIKEEVERVSGEVFNSTLLNLYRDGNDSMGWHSDAEDALGKNPVVASLSFGTPREFQFRHRVNKSETITTLLPHGSLLLMRGALQHNWVHQLPKRKKVAGIRINVTFRLVRTTSRF